MLPSPDILNVYEHGKFVLSNLAAKRAKQLREGATPLVQIESTHPLTIALAEIAAGKIKPVLQPIAKPVIDHDSTPTLLVAETVPAEMGMLLPALDETEVALVATIDEEHDEHHDDADLSISDILDEDETDPAEAPSEDDPLSLTDLAEQESTGEDDNDSDES